MAIEKVRAYMKTLGMEERIREFDVSSATVLLAAQALGTDPARIAKSLAFRNETGALLVVTAGDAKIDNAKFRNAFQTKARMLTPEETLNQIGHAIGGVCPFAVHEDVTVVLDVSLKRFETVFPACGSANSAIELKLEELETCAKTQRWVDVCKDWEVPR